MGYNLEIRPKAEPDAENAIDYYFVISIDLAVRFNDELYAAYEKIGNNPQFYKYISNRRNKQIRFTKLKSFPYIVIFRVKGNTVVVMSVFNTHRKPVYGQP